MRSRALPDEEVIGALTSVKGIGRWTAEMFLMFRLHRPDVLPVGDLGIVKAVQRAYKLRLAPTPVRLTRLGENWRPYRSVACWYLWASLDNKGTVERVTVMYTRAFISFLFALVLAIAGSDDLVGAEPRQRRRRPTSRGCSSRSTRCPMGSR